MPADSTLPLSAIFAIYPQVTTFHDGLRRIPLTYVHPGIQNFLYLTWLENL